MKLLIIEDEPQLAEGITAYMNREGYRCETAARLEDAREKILLHTYDCILLDLMLPDGSGFAVLEQLKKQGIRDGVIIISAKGSLDDRVAGLKLGADDYLSKPFHLAELSARIGAVIRRKKFNGSDRLHVHELEIDVQAQVVQVNGSTLLLTRKEYDLLLFLISNRGRVVSKNAIAEHLSGDMADMLDDFGFVYAHMKNLKKKLHDHHCADHIKTIYGFGYQYEA